MSFREKSAWISILTTAGIYGLYFWPIFPSGLRAGGFHFGRLLGTIILLVVVQVVLNVALAIFAPKEADAPQDEREKLIDLKATKLGYGVLAGSVGCACFFGGFDPPIVFNTNALLFILVMAEILRSGCQIVQFRRGA